MDYIIKNAPMKAVLPNYDDQAQSKDLQSLVNGLYKNSNERLLNACQNEYYNRFKNYIYKIAVQICRNSNFNKNDNFWAEEITQYTFIQALFKLKSSEFIFSENDDEKLRVNKMKGWLGRIANFEFKKVLSKKYNELVIYDESQIPEISYEMLSETIDKIEVPSEIKKSLLDTLSTLKPRDLDIITTYVNENCVGTNLHLSDYQMVRLCKTYQTTPENIRQIKKRTIELIKKKCNI